MLVALCLFNKSHRTPLGIGSHDTVRHILPDLRFGNAFFNAELVLILSRFVPCLDHLGILDVPTN